MKIMDTDSFEMEMDHDKDVIIMILTELIHAIEDQIPLMKKLLNDNKYDIVSREAHSIKGGARNVMAERLEVASEELEKTALVHEKNSSLIAIEKLSNEFLRLKEYIINYYPLLKLA